MEDIEKTLLRLKSISLTDSERTLMRNGLEAYMHENKARPSSFSRLLGRAEALIALRSGVVRAQWAVASLAVAVITVGAGTSYAAQTALPGDTLYSVKIHLNEPLEGTVADIQGVKASWDANLADRRLSEAQTLAVQGRLTPAAAAGIKTQLSAVADDFNTDVAELARTPGKAVAAASAQSDLKATLDAHSNTLIALAASAPEAADTASIALTEMPQAMAKVSAVKARTNVASSSNASTTTVSTKDATSTPATTQNQATEFGNLLDSFETKVKASVEMKVDNDMQHASSSSVKDAPDTLGAQSAGATSTITL